MRILFLAPFIPSPERPDSLHHLRLLSANHKVTLVALYSQSAELAELDQVKRWAQAVYPFRLTKVSSYTSCALRLLSRWPLYLAYYYSPALVHQIRDIACRHNFDLVHAHTLRMAPYAQYLDSIPKVCNIQDVLTPRYEAYVKKGRLSPKWLLDIEEWQKLKRFEPWLCKQIGTVGVVSEEEAQLLHKLVADVPVHIVRPGVDPGYFEPLPDVERKLNVVFLGRLSYRPNVESALWIANSIFPQIRRRVPEAKLVIVGSDPPTRVKALSARDGIKVTGWVPDVRQYLGRAIVSLCPMKTGGGVKHKILQSLALATPVVTNTWGATGLGLTPGVNYLLAEDDTSLAEACIDVLNSPTQRKAIGEAGREHVVQRHGWDRIAESLEVFHNQAL